MATGGVPTAATTTGTLDIDKDSLGVRHLLEPLTRDELNQLFEELGLSYATRKNRYDSDNVVYAGDLIRAWMLGKDRVLEMGGVTKENMIRALAKISQTALASSYATTGRCDQGQEQQPQKSAMVSMRGATNVNMTYSTYDPSHMHYDKEPKSQLAEHTTETDSGVAPEQNTSGIEVNSQQACTEQQMPDVQELSSRRQSTPTPTSILPIKEHHIHKEENDSLVVDDMHHDNPDDEKSSSTSESSLSKQESQSDDKNEMVLKETTAPLSTLSQRFQNFRLDIIETEKTCEEQRKQLQQKDDEIYQKDAKISQLEEEKDDTDKRYQKEIQSLNEEKTKDKNELDKLRSQIAELEKRLLEKDKETANLQGRTYPHSNDLCKELRKQLKQERNKVKQKENEIIQLELKLKTTELELEKADNRYKDELRDVAAERDAIKVEHAQLKEKIAEEKQRNAEEKQRKAEGNERKAKECRRKSEEENKKLKEELQRLNEKLLHQNKT